MSREAFLEARKNSIGGSDIAHVLSVEPWGCRRRLVFEKRGIEPDYPIVETGPMKRGTRLEEVAAEEYSKRTLRTVRRMPQTFHKTKPHLHVNNDRMMPKKFTPEQFANGSNPTPGVLEIKVPGPWVFRQVQAQGLSEGYILQLQHAMGVTGWKWGSFAIFEPSAWELMYWDVQRDDELIAEIEAQCDDAWRQVENGPWPDKLPPKSKQCQGCPWRRSCQGEELLKMASRQQEGKPDTDDTIAPELSNYLEAKDLLSDAEKLVEFRREELVKKVGDRTAVECDGHRIYYRAQKGAKYIDAKAFRAEHPDLAEKYTRERAPSRPLRIYSV